MELFYYKAKQGNVGDDLNYDLWPRILGKTFFEEGGPSRFIGIGSVFDKRHPKLPDGKNTLFLAPGCGAGGRFQRTCLDLISSL